MDQVKISKNILVKPTDTIRTVMRKLTDTNFRFQLVVLKKKLVGTVVDGDIRRAILRGNSLETKIENCMNKKPVKGRLGKDAEFKKLINSIKSEIKFLPLINSKNELSHVILENKKEYKKNFIIMAGGFGTRLGYKTKYTPKPLLKINKKPILEHILEKVEESEYSNIYLSTYYLHNKIKNYILKRKAKTNINIILEKKPLGTAGSIYYLQKDSFDCLVVINGDLITDIDLNALTDFHIENKNDITITIAKYTYNLPFGLVNFDKSLNFKSLKEKPDISNFVLSGIYCLSKSCCNLIKNKKIDMTEVIDKSYSLNKKIGIFPIFEYWKDIGNLKDFISENNKIKNNTRTK